MTTEHEVEETNESQIEQLTEKLDRSKKYEQKIVGLEREVAECELEVESAKLELKELKELKADFDSSVGKLRAAIKHGDELELPFPPDEESETATADDWGKELEI